MCEKASERNAGKLKKMLHMTQICSDKAGKGQLYPRCLIG